MSVIRKAMLALLLGASSLASSQAADILLRLPAGATGNHFFYHALLQQALQAAGHTVQIEVVFDVPQPRLVSFLETGQITLLWMLQTPERDAQFVRVGLPLTQGLIGQRVLLIPKGQEGRYAGVRDLAQFRASGAVAGLGKGWFDASVWQTNQLEYVEQAGDWRKPFQMLPVGDRGVHYIPRGVSEVLAEARNLPELAIEPRLVLVYERDFFFYLSKSGAALKPIIEGALLQAQRSGLHKRLVDEYFSAALKSLELDKRVRIKLVTPP